MEELLGKDFVWKIKNLSQLQPKDYCSDPFLIGGCKWRILATPKGNNLIQFSYLYLGVANPKSCNSRWRSNVSLRFTIVNKLVKKFTIVKNVRDSDLCFDDKSSPCRYPIVLLNYKLPEVVGGFLVKVVVEVVSHRYEATETLGGSDNLTRVEENHGLKTNDLLSETQELGDRVDVNGFQVFPQQIGFVKRILERYPDIGSEVRPKKQCLRTSYMNVILGLIETLCQLPEELTNDDLEEATVALSFAAKGGFKVDWLEEVKEKKKKVDTGEARLQQIEEEMHQQFEKEMYRLKDLMDKENAEVSAAKVPFSFDDVV